MLPWLALLLWGVGASLTDLLSTLDLDLSLAPRFEAAGIESLCDLHWLKDEDYRDVLGLKLAQHRRVQALVKDKCAASAGLPLTTFGCIHSEPFQVTASEFTVCEHRSSVPGAITHMQFTWSGNAENVHFRAYVDDEKTPSIDVQMEQGMFAVEVPQIPDPSAERIKIPWGNERIGRGGNLGGRYFNFRIPYTKSIRLALYSISPTVETACFTIIRGADGAVATAGGLVLPSTARLRVYTEWAAVIDKYAHLIALNTTGPGVMAMWILLIFESNMGLSYLEGCQRAWLDGNLVQIGDGEDYFDSGYYFDAGVYAFPQAGLLEKGNNSTMAYRINDWDPVVWQSSANITWRNCETYPKCVDAGSTPKPDPTFSVGATSFLWYYSL